MSNRSKPRALRAAAMELRKQGHSYREIQKEINVSLGTLSLWFSKFADATNLEIMTKSRNKKGRYVPGVQAPVAAACSSTEEQLQEKIARLEKELRQAKLKADLYHEILRVSEQQFGISLLKKAGTKQ